MSKANETNQTKPEFKIKSCEECVALDACRNNDYFEDDGSWYCGCEIRENIERLVNAKR
jgi:hypothetical protein